MHEVYPASVNISSTDMPGRLHIPNNNNANDDSQAEHHLASSLGLVSVVIPTKNSVMFLEMTLESLASQTYPDIEILVIDGGSVDGTQEVAIKYGAKVLDFQPPVPDRKFDAPHRRNFGARQSKGNYIYYVDADMRLEDRVIAESVSLCRNGHAAVIVPERSYGVGIWARAKRLERDCYLGDDTVEAPRFLIADIWRSIGGLDESLGGGGDDWDLHEEIKTRGLNVGRTQALVWHNEGELTLRQLATKRFRYGRDSIHYLRKRPRAGLISYFPIRKAYLKHWRDFAQDISTTLAFIIMRSTEYGAGFAGMVAEFKDCSKGHRKHASE